MSSDIPTPIANPVVAETAAPPQAPAPVIVPMPPLPAPAPLARQQWIPRPPQPPWWRQFTAWPGATSLVTLVSAACLLAGLWGVLLPTIGEENADGDRWSVLSTLAAYLGSLLAGIWAMCRARAGNPDAVASTVVGAALAVGYGVVLSLLAPTQPGLALGAALVGACSLAGLWLGWAHVTASEPVRGLGAPLAGLALWACVWPAVLGWQVRLAGVEQTGTAHGDPAIAVMQWWTSGWLLLLAVLAGLLLVAMRGGDPCVGLGRPFLSRGAMRWVIALVVAACAVIAALLQAHIAGLDLAWSDCLPHLALLTLVGNELHRRVAGNRLVRDAALVAALPWVAALMTVYGGVPHAGQVRGAGWAPTLTATLSSAPLLPAVLAVLAGIMAWRHRAPGLALGAGLALAALVLAADPLRPLGSEAVAVVFTLSAVAAWCSGRSDLAATASCAAAACLGAGRIVQEGLHLHAPVATAILAASVAAVLWGGAVPTSLVRGWVRTAGWILGLTASLIVLTILYGVTPEGWRLVGAIALATAFTAMDVWCGWRRLDSKITLAAIPPLAFAAWSALREVLPERRAWLIVWAAFGLLGGAVWIAIRRARRGG